MSTREKKQVRNAVYSIGEFCEAHGISRAMLYKLQHGGIAPRTKKVGTRTLITEEAAADWRRDREAETAAAAKAARRHAEAGATAA
jgi:predicted DNA-binding transcriptional regulator AlpA